MTRTVFFDESGFTGSNLLDTDQPIFAIGSTDLSNEESEEILKRSFPHYQSSEYKFQNIWKYQKRRKELITFAHQFAELYNRSFIYYIDKKFAVLTKIMDFLVEPLYHNAGFDFYGDSFNKKYSNYVYFGITQFAPPRVFDSLISTYQKFSRNPNERELRNLQSFLKDLVNDTDKEINFIFQQMASGAELFERFSRLEDIKGSDDLQFTTMLAVIAHWRQKYSEDLIVIHDASSNFARKKEIWDSVTNKDVRMQAHRLGDGSFVEFPLRVKETHSVNSKESYSVQLCDILSGLSSKLFDSSVVDSDRGLLNEIIKAGLHNLVYKGIYFESEFPESSGPPRLNGSDVVDQMTDIIYGNSFSTKNK